MRCFLHRIRWHGKERFIIWLESDSDSVVSDEGGNVIAFSTPELLQNYAVSKALRLEPQDETTLQDLDYIARWVKVKDAIDCAKMLDAWNLLEDISSSGKAGKSSEFKKLSAGLSPLYDKLFWGCNLPSVTPNGERFVPEWSTEEIDSLARLLSEGLTCMEPLALDPEVDE